MQAFTDEPLIAIVRFVGHQLAESGSVRFTVPHPDSGVGLYTGEMLSDHSRHRPWRVWLDLAEKLECRFSVPDTSPGTVTLRFDKLRPADRSRTPADPSEKYGAGSYYSRIDKLEESSFLLDYLEALDRIALKPGARVLSLGVNTGNELRAFDYLESGVGSSLSFVGIDHSASAVAQAERDFGARGKFIRADINALSRLELDTFDLVMALGTLQSPGIDDRAVLRHAVQTLVEKSGSLLVGFPNSTYLGNELVYGARMKNFSQAELSLLVRDAAYYRKYLQQHNFKVFVTGKYYLFITAVPV